MDEKSLDMIVIGAGPGGYVAAIRGAQLGLNVAIVEREHMGGICLNWGCIPTKALLRSAEVYHLMQRAAEFGLSAGKPGFDLDAVVKRSRGIAKQLNSGVTHLMKKNKIKVVIGEATLAGKGRVSIATKDGTEALQFRQHRPGIRRAGARTAGVGGRWRPGLDLSPRPAAAADA